MIVVVGQFRFPAARMEQARPVMRQVIEATRAEQCCVQYNYGEDVLDPGLIRVSEFWQSREHLDAHMQTAHMVQWQRERAELGLSGREILVFEADQGVPL
ncbi:MAG: putative quinol monooxygenase [Novosphingobium sp.]|uniref:putative quinol monooxygenase n=1 Tax=Novosphingobium sp. TaxID=1874826 RepID=UPI003C7BB644